MSASPLQGVIITLRRMGHLPSPAVLRTEAGSALLLMLFACLVVAVVVQALSTVTLIAERAAEDESSGRARLSEKDSALATVRQSLLEHWGPLAPTWLETEEESASFAVEARVDKIPESDDRLMKVMARHDPSVSRMVVSATAERGRDGIDLPVAAVVAGSLAASMDRELPWVDSEDFQTAGETPDIEVPSPAVPCYFSDLADSARLSPACVVHSLDAPWRLDPGWLQAAPETESPEVPTVALGEGTIWLSGARGSLLQLPPECGAGRPDAPLLVVIGGGAGLDARNLGDLYAVIVVDDGSIRLDGTAVHGAVFVTDEVDLGESGRILFAPKVLRWATDRSLERVRLVPGTRREAID